MPRTRTHVSEKASRFTESVIREMTRQALEHGAINLAQGFPDFPAPEDVKRAAVQAIEADVNQYAITWGARDFRQAIARKTAWHLGLEVDPERELTVTCGSTEAMVATMMAFVFGLNAAFSSSGSKRKPRSGRRGTKRSVAPESAASGP